MTSAFFLLGAAMLIAAPPTARGGIAGRHRSGPGAISAGWSAGGAVAVLAVAVAAFGLRLGLLAAVVLLPAAKTGFDWLRSRPEPVTADPLLPAALDLAAAALRSGASVASALALAAPATSPGTAARMTAVAGLLRLGAPAAEAWADLGEHPQLGQIAAVARRGAGSGIRLASMWEDTATELRGQLHTAASTRAARAGVLAMAPLGLCFLPAFVCLGVVPDVIALFGGGWTSLLR